MKKILIGLFVLSAISAASTEQDTFTNRIGINITDKGTEKWDGENSEINIYNESFGINYKLLYNFTKRLRLGLEMEYDALKYSNEFTEGFYIDSDYRGLFLYGLTGEFDFYKNDQLSLYLNGSLGLAYSELDMDVYFDKLTLAAKSYAKLGLGTRFQNGLGLEIGSRAVVYNLESSYFSDDMTKQQYYVEMNFTF